MANKGAHLLVLATLGAIICSDAAWSQFFATAPEFTTSSLKGVCGFNSASTGINPTSGSFMKARSAAGTFAFNGAGTVTETFTKNKAGTLVSATFTGTYSVGPDGRTGTIDLTASGGSLFKFVITSNGVELRLIRTGPINPSLGIIDTVDIGLCKF